MWRDLRPVVKYNEDMNSKFEKIFGTRRPLIGMIHFPPLFGVDGYPGFEYIRDKMLNELAILEKTGVDAVMIENNYDIPHTESVDGAKGAMMGVLSQILSEATKLPIGIDILWNDYATSLVICESTRISFFRVPAFVDSVITSYGLMERRAEEVVRLRKDLGLNDSVLILADIQVKHSEMVDKDKPLSKSALEAVEMGADAVIVTGKWTGDVPRTDDLQEVRNAVGEFPIIVGSGASVDNLPSIMKYADGVIVGTALKEGESKDKSEEINLKPFEYTLDIQRAKMFVKQYRQETY
jgi:uncharacterized protein